MDDVKLLIGSTTAYFCKATTFGYGRYTLDNFELQIIFPLHKGLVLISLTWTDLDIKILKINNLTLDSLYSLESNLK